MKYLQKYFKLVFQWLNKISSTNITCKGNLSTESQDLEKILQIESLFHIPQIYGFVFHENTAVSHQAKKRICSLLTKNSEKIPWLRLDESYRYFFLSNNKCITKRDLKKAINNFDEKEAAHLVGISSMNSNGYLREDALKILSGLFTAEIIPYLLLRFNDWVPAVYKMSIEVFQSKLTKFHPIELIRNFILIERLERLHRNNLNNIKDEMCDHIASHKFREEVFDYLYKRGVKENLFYWKLLSKEISQNRTLINQALTCKYPEVRQWIISYLPKDGLYTIYLNKLLKDKSLRVRYSTLRSIPSVLRQKNISLFQEGLIDHAKKIREYSRFILEQLSSQDFRKLYQEKLSDSYHSTNISVLLGWIEVAQSDDLEDILRLLKSPIRKIRKTAFQALVRLKFTRSHEHYLEGMTDSNAKIRSICAEVLKKIADQVQTEISRLLTSKPLGVQEAALSVLSSQRPSEALKSLLYALTLPDKNLEGIAWRYLDKWHKNYSVRPYFSMDIQLYNEIMQLYEIIGTEKKASIEKLGLWKVWNDLPQLLRLLKID